MATMRRLRIGMIGAGSHANRVHYPSLASIEEAEIAAICDMNRERLHKTAEKYGVKSRYVDYREMLEKEELDAVYVIMPPHHLYDIVVDCLRDGFNVFIEKPPGITTNQTRSLAWFAERYGCRTMVGFNRRFIPLMRLVKAMVEEKGRINQCVSAFYKNLYPEEPPYYRGAVDVLTSDVIHAVDTLRWMGGGEVRRVCSSVRSLFTEYPNSFNALVEFDGGVVGFLMSNWAAGSRIHTFEMHSKNASAFVNPDDKAIIYMDNKPEPRVVSTFEAAGGSKEFYKYYGFYDENRHFIECILKDEEPETCFSDAVKTMELVDQIYRNSIT
ncbi:gfo/Idh/MocA family oxidoreductase [Candidatus Bathyarchaeota archaeon]|nr:MAG: gfo/Idh/MocA family oxidoreductase [Candidatus Bathyarchaeota archaeon]